MRDIDKKEEYSINSDNKKIFLENIKAKIVEFLAGNKYLRLLNVNYGELNYTVATRRKNPLCMLTNKERQKVLPDAVSCVVIVNTNLGPKLLLQNEFRYPIGGEILSVPAGLIDEIDKSKDRNEAIINTAMRELKEETGLNVSKDNINIISSGLFSSAGMTDESNALVCVIVENFDENLLSRDGIVGDEKIGKFFLLGEDDAKKILKNGVDQYGNNYSTHTQMALYHFISGMWKETF